MEFSKSKKGILVTQRRYVLRPTLRNRFTWLQTSGYSNGTKCETRSNKNRKNGNQEKYQRLVGKLIYLSHTQPDIALVISEVSQFMHSLGDKHFEAVQRILKYLKGTVGGGLLFENHGHFHIEAYMDVDWVGSVMDR